MCGLGGAKGGSETGVANDVNAVRGGPRAAHLVGLPLRDANDGVHPAQHQLIQSFIAANLE